MEYPLYYVVMWSNKPFQQELLHSNYRTREGQPSWGFQDFVRTYVRPSMRPSVTIPVSTLVCVLSYMANSPLTPNIFTDMDPL